MSIPPLVKAGASALPGAGRLPFLPGGGGDVPERTLEAGPSAADPTDLAAYARVCGYTLKPALPPTWPHIQAFDLHMKLLTDGGFPFGPLGLVHIANEITQHRPIETSEELAVSARPTPLEPHPKGRVFSLVSEARAGEELVWEERSTMLRRGGSGGGGKSTDETGEGNDDRGRSRPGSAGERGAGAPPIASWWKLPSDLGARYAAVSGDSNPIHMHSLTAKPFGFPRAIAHGMWTKARCLAALESALPDSFTVAVEFGRPILLPAEVGFGAEPGAGEIRFAVLPRGDGKPHLTGALTKLESNRTEG